MHSVYYLAQNLERSRNIQATTQHGLIIIIIIIIIILSSLSPIILFAFCTWKWKEQFSRFGKITRDDHKKMTDILNICTYLDTFKEVYWVCFVQVNFPENGFYLILCVQETCTTLLWH